MREFRLQCTQTDKLWPRTYPTAKAAISAQGQWNSTHAAVYGSAGKTVAGGWKATVGNLEDHPPVRVVEVEVTVVSVVRDALLSEEK